MAPENKLLRDYLKTAADRGNVYRMYLVANPLQGNIGREKRGQITKNILPLAEKG